MPWLALDGLNIGSDHDKEPSRSFVSSRVILLTQPPLWGDQGFTSIQGWLI